MGIYKPGWQAKDYHRYPRIKREEIAREVDKIFARQTGVTRSLDPTSKEDLELRRKWLRIRDEVIEEKIEEETDELRRDFWLDSIPGEMEHMGWTQAAQLLETWFERPPAVAPKYSAPVTDVIKIDWVLGFDRTAGYMTR